MARFPLSKWINRLHDFSISFGCEVSGVSAVVDLKRGSLKPVFDGKCGEQITCHTQSARSNGTGGRREEIWDVAGLGFAGSYTVSVIAIKEGGLHDAYLLPLSMEWPKLCRSRLDLTDLANIRE